MTKKRKNNMTRGFTLIELIVASGIFAILTLIAFSTLTQSEAIEARTQVVRRVGQTNRFTLETIAREVQLANGAVQKNEIGELRQTAPSFAILGSGGTSPSEEIATHWQIGSELKITSSNMETGERVSKRIYLGLNQTGNQVVMMDVETCTNQICRTVNGSALSPDGVLVEELVFHGLDPSRAVGVLNRHPFLEVSVTTASLPTEGRPTEIVRQTLKTLVSMRSYRFL